MNKKYAKLLAMTMAGVIGSSTAFACGAVPSPDISRHQATTVCAPANQKQNKQEVFVIDNFKVISTTLEQLGVTYDELQGLIKEGKKLKDVLEVKEINVKKFKKELIKQYNKVIDEGVNEGKLTKEEGKMLKKAIKEKIMNWLNS